MPNQAVVGVVAVQFLRSSSTRVHRTQKCRSQSGDDLSDAQRRRLLHGHSHGLPPRLRSRLTFATLSRGRIES